jgi:mono/diheme cytochrome c family protein
MIAIMRSARAVSVFVAIGAASAIAVFGGYVLLARGPGSVLSPEDTKVIARGKAVYMQQCASCHGPNLEGQPDWRTRDKDGFMPAPPHDETGHTWHHPDQLLFEITKLGVVEAANLKDYKTRMPAFSDVLTDEDIIAALSYIKSRWPGELRQGHDQLNRVYAERANWR